MKENTEIIQTKVNDTVRPYIDNLARFETIVAGARSVATSFAECRRLSAEVERQRQQLDYQLNSMLIQSQHNLETRRLYAPIIGAQLDRIQDRIDKFSDKLMDLMDDFSPEGFEKQSFLLDFIERQNTSFQQLSLKLMI